MKWPLPKYRLAPSIPTYCGGLCRFDSSGKEKDSETGLSYFGARYYDANLLTGWLSVDPMADKYPSLSPYNYCASNPMKLVDPDGSEIADFYDSRGQYLGTDGVADQRIFVVTDDAEIEQIIDNGGDCSIQFTNANAIKSKYELLPQNLREKIINDLNVDYSQQKNREYGGVAVQQIDGTISLGHFNPGDEYLQGSRGSISNEICDKDKWILDNCTNGLQLTRYHCHGIWLEQVPSTDDYVNYSKSPTQYGYAMQMGMLTKTVNFYNGAENRPLFSMTLDAFITIGK